MSNKKAKIRIKLGSIEVEYEGDPSFIEEGLNDLVQSVWEIHSSLPPPASPIAHNRIPEAPADPVADTATPSGLGLSTKSIAGRLDAKSGPELIISAMAHLELVKSLESYDKKNIFQEMKTATGYYNSNMSGNNASNLAKLVKNKRVTEVGTDKYCLSAMERKKVEASIADDG